MEKKIEQRIVKDSNGFYNCQVRFLPVNAWEPNDGWGTFYVTSVLENAKRQIGEGR